MASDPKVYDWGPKGMLVSKNPDEGYIEKADLGFLGGASSKIVKNLPGYAWSAKGMKAGTKYAKISDVQALMGGKPSPAPNPEPVPTSSEPTPVPSPPPPKPITSLRIQSTGDKTQTNVPFTVGQVFKQGDLPAGKGLVGVAESGAIPLQCDVKALHPDGSARHAVVSGILPRVDSGKDIVLCLAPTPEQQKGFVNAVAAPVVSVLVDGKTYHTNGINLQGRVQWLGGPIVSESQTKQPLFDDKGQQHPHLCARFGSRVYSNGAARLEVLIENDWAYEPDPRNFTYDVLVEFNGQTLYEKKALTHLHHARWRKLFWVGSEPKLHVRLNTAYLIASRAVPNYDQSVVTPESALTTLMSKWTGSAIEPMGVGLANPYMPSTGGRNDLGIMPGWAATYLLSMDPRAKTVTLGTADLAGSWSAHYRDKNTDRPISLVDYPYMTILGIPTDTKNPATKQLEAFPKCMTGASCTSTNVHDSSHQPGFAYLPYLLTGDYYYLEELQFWAMYNVFMSNPGYRQNVKGLVYRDQVRGQAWSMRTLGEAAYITPDAHPLKSHFLRILKSNLDYYNAKYSTNPAANKLGVLDMSSAVIYSEDTNDDGTADKKTAVAPWQDDFFTQALGHLVDLGFEDALPLLRWKAQFPIGRMIGDGFCWMLGANYTLAVRSDEKAPIYDSFRQVYVGTIGEKIAALPCGSDELAKALGQKPNDMGGYSSTPIGYPSNMQPALAYAADYCGDPGVKAWAHFMSRSIKPNYSLSPQFNIVPR